MKKCFSILFLIVIVTNGCKKIINPNIVPSAPKLVIEGNVSNIPHGCWVNIEYTTPLDSIYTMASTAAVVTVSDGMGNVHHLKSGGYHGYYDNTFIGVPGRTYTLKVVIDGNTYTATSTMPQLVNLDTLLTDRIMFGNKSIIDVTPVYLDPSGFGNCYQFVETINKTLNPHIFVFDDRYNDGTINTRPLVETDSTINSGDSIAVEMRCIDKNVYNYFNALNQLNNNSTTPANPPTNIMGGCLGYFSAHTSQTKKIKVP